MDIKEEILVTLFIPCFFMTIFILFLKISSTKAYNKNNKKRISKNEKLEWVKSKIWILDSWYGFNIYDFVYRPIYFHLDYSEKDKNKYISDILDKVLKNWDNVINIWTWNCVIPIIIAKKIWQKGNIFCFERYKETCELLKSNFDLNFLSNFQINNVVASYGKMDSLKVRKIRRYPWYNLLTYILFDIPLLFVSLIRFLFDLVIRAIWIFFNYKSNPSQFYDMVPVNSIDNILYETNTKIDLIVINQNEPDIYKVCYGLEKIIKKHHPKIIFTIIINYNTNQNTKIVSIDPSSKEFLDWIEWLNYNIYEWINWQGGNITFKRIYDLKSESSILGNRYWWDSYIKTIYLQ